MITRGIVVIALGLMGTAVASAQLISLPCPQPVTVQMPCPDQQLPALIAPLFVVSARVAPQIDWRYAPDERTRVEFSPDPTFSSQQVIHSSWTVDGVLHPDPSFWRRISRTAGKDHTLYARAVYQIEGGRQLVAPAVRLHLTR